MCALKADPNNLCSDIEKSSEPHQLIGVHNDYVYITWDGPDDPENPIRWSKERKWALSGLGYGFLILSACSVSSYVISQPSLESALNVSHFTGTLGLIAFVIPLGAAPLILAPFSELFGRAPVFRVSAFTFWIMFIPQALAQACGPLNHETVLVARCISGIGASTSIGVVGGILADIWETHERGLPMAIFSFMAFVGTGLGPVSFGYVELSLGYQCINWILFGVSGIFSLSLILMLKETRASVILIKKAAHLRAKTGNMQFRARAEEERSSVIKMVKISLTRPLVLLFTEPVLFAFTAWITYAWGILYLMLESVPLVFTQLYGFNAGESGLVFIGQVIGPVLGLVVNVWCDRAYARNVSRKGPEARLYIAMFSGVALPIGCWMYTWTSWREVHWIAPTIGICIIYTAMFGIYVACFNYLADSYTIYASSALSGQSCVRFLVGGLFSLIAQPMYQKLGIHTAGSILAAMSSIFAVTPFLLYRYGANIRARSFLAKRLLQGQLYVSRNK